MTNELAVLNDLNFNELNTSIEQLGERNKELSDGEKTNGIQILDDWKTNVIDKLCNKESEINKLRQLLTNGESYHYDEAEKRKAQEKLAGIAKAKKIYNAFLEMGEQLKEYDLTQPQRPNVNPDRTVAQNDLDYAEFEKNLRKWSIERSKQEFQKNQVYSKFLLTVKRSPEVKKMLRQMDNYMLKVKQYKADCRDKAQLAKINLSISDKKAREAIQDIVNFTQGIK